MFYHKIAEFFEEFLYNVFLKFPVWLYLWMNGMSKVENEYTSKDDEDWLDIEEELPFIQLWKLNDRESLALREIIRTPDETAVVYVINDEGYTKNFRRRVYEGSYIKVDGKKFYLKKK